MRVTAVRVGGAVVALGDVLADVTIHHGRADVTTTADASSAQLTLLGVPRSLTATFTVGRSLELDTDTAGRRFTGTITDAQLDDDRLTVLGVGNLAKWGRKQMPAGWTAPAEPWSDRVDRLIALAGMTRQNIPWQAGEWFSNGVGVIQDDGGAVPYTFWNMPAGTAANSWLLPHTADRNRFPIRSGARYRVSSREIVWPSADTSYTLIIDGLAGGAYAAYVPAPGALAWDFVAPADSIAAGARIVVYMGSPPPVDSWLAIQPITIEMAPGYVVVPDPEFNPLLAAVDGTQGESTLADELAAVADDVGALVCDLPDGRIFVQALGGRTFAGADVIDPADVLYAPPWIQTDEVTNEVTVKYAGGEVFTSDPGSIGIYDRRPSSIETTLANVADANRRANERLARAAYARWVMPGCPILEGYPLELGAAVSIDQLPPASPFAYWTAMVEGWTDTITGPDWTIDLALSDPFQSGVALAWNEVPAGDLWNTINQTVAWKDALSPESIAP